jgi:hypothetical protein
MPLLAADSRDETSLGKWPGLGHATRMCIMPTLLSNPRLKRGAWRRTSMQQTYAFNVANLVVQ